MENMENGKWKLKMENGKTLDSKRFLFSKSTFISISNSIWKNECGKWNLNVDFESRK